MLQAVYFCFFMAVGVSMPFLPPYLRDLGLGGREMATVLAIPPALNLVVPLAWAWLADRTRTHARVLQVVCLGAAIGFSSLLGARRFPALFVGYAAYAVFGVGIGGLVDSLTIARVRAQPAADYGRIRAWGSVGFVIASIGAGLLLTARGGRLADPLVPALMVAALAATFLSSLRIRGSGERGARPRWSDVRALLRDRPLRLLLAVAPLHWMSSGPYNILFGIFVRDHRLSPAVVGLAFAVGVGAEVLVLLGFRRLHRRFSLETLLAVAFAGTAVRWLLVSRAEATAAVIGLQSLHGLTFGLFWGAGIARVADRVPAALRATGQALFVTTLGVGNVCGYLASGAIYDAGGGVAPAFLAAAALELVPLGLVLAAAARARRAAQPPPAAATGGG